ncbi:hypothetical protein GEOBRER4_n3739 [Citrifermentans bremense]|uniref:Uncharacterized protein n=1 Tax=Citrifermentans bremense TaxID=60035 RepID=A0A6S6MBL2_9BACT|nr:tyrosine-type recombinase/integrase [Citrifermentans bremense]BCG48845.1 hypothetical protein GEOBRER4_n3739 [Citrifermentans bremense]
MGKIKSFEVPKLFFTDKNCWFDDLSRPGVGILVDEYGAPIYPVIDWLIVQRKRKSRPDDTGTMKQLASDLRMFWEFLSRERQNWQEVNDNFLMRWRDRMANGARVSAEQKSVQQRNSVTPLKSDTINRRLSTVFRFYLWCKANEKVPEGTIGHGGKYRITVEKGKNNEDLWVGRLRSDGTLPKEAASDEDVEKLHDAMDEIFGKVTARRNRLYLDWNRYLGLRGVEASTLQVSMIPQLEEIEQYIIEKKPYPMPFKPKGQGLRTKGGRVRRRPLDVDPMLLKHTRDYIDFERVELVKRAKKLYGRGYKEPDAVFLATTGDTLGERVKTKTMQEAVTKAITKAGLKITPHDLRRLFAMEVVSNLYLWKFRELEKQGHNCKVIAATIDDNSIISYASQQLGHRFKTTTLKHYLDLTKLKLIKMTAGERLEYFERHKGITQAAYKQYLSEESVGTLERLKVKQYLLAEEDGLLDALRDGDSGRVFRILMKHLGANLN